MNDIVYFSINDWFQGLDYPPDEIFAKWVGLNSPLSDGAWCKEHKICVKHGCIDMSQNWCVSAPRSFVEEYCPKLLTDEEYTYETLLHTKGETILNINKNRYSNFVYTPDKYGDIEDRFGWAFLEYNEDNFGVTWYEENPIDYDVDEEDDDINSDDDADCWCE